VLIDAASSGPRKFVSSIDRLHGAVFGDEPFDTRLLGDWC
jgi:hypothetical protein